MKARDLLHLHSEYKCRVVSLLHLKARIDAIKQYKHSNKYYRHIAIILGGYLINLSSLDENTLVELEQYLDNVQHKKKI